MIIETKPLHKKKKRLAKQRSIREIQGSLSIDLVSHKVWVLGERELYIYIGKSCENSVVIYKEHEKDAIARFRCIKGV